MKKLNDWIPLLVIWVVAAASIWPVLRHPETALAWGGDDGIITWELNQTIAKIPGELNHLFDGNIFYPYKNTMALNMLLIPSAVIGYLPVKLTGNPIVAYNTALIVAQFLTVTVLFFWLKEMSGNGWAATIGTVVFAVCQIRMFFDVHIHMWIMQWLLIAGWMLWRYARNKQVWQLYIAGLFFGVQAYESIYQAFWILLMAVILLWPVREDLRRQLKHVVTILAGVGVMTAPASWAYFSVYRQFGYAGSIREAANFAMSINDLWGKFSSPGLFMLLLVAAIKLVKHKTRETRWLVLLMILGGVMALGPVLKWNDRTVKILGKLFIPLPYGLMYYLIPGVSVLRSVHRYIWLAALAASGLIALGFKDYDLRIRKTAFWALLLVAVVGGGRLAPRGDFPKPSAYPAVYSWLVSQPGQVILEYPVYTWADGAKHGIEMYRMVYSLKHKKNLVNGAAGFVPPDREDLFVKVINSYPNAKLDKELTDLGVNYVVVHKDETDPVKLLEIRSDNRLVWVWEDTTTVVFSL